MFDQLRQALERVAAEKASARSGPTEPARARRGARDGSEVPFEDGKITFPATVTQFPTPQE